MCPHIAFASSVAAHILVQYSLVATLQAPEQKGEAYIIMASTVMAYIVMAYIVMDYMIMAYIAMAHVVAAYMVMAYIVMA